LAILETLPLGTQVILAPEYITAHSVLSPRF